MTALPSLLHDLARQWDLTTTGEEFWHGYSAVVFPVGQGGRPLALKLAWPPDQVRGEADALAVWQARDAATVLYSPGAALRTWAA